MGPRFLASPGCPREELDLVRVYLSHVGKRQLLKAREEQELGRRIEDARGAVQAALAPLPCAVKTLLSLADHVRAGTAPAAELILLPDGGELQAGEHRYDPDLVRTDPAVAGADGRRAAPLRDKRSSTATRATYRKTMTDANAEVAAVLRTLPLRPSLVDQIVGELREVEQRVRRRSKSCRARAAPPPAARSRIAPACRGCGSAARSRR